MTTRAFVTGGSGLVGGALIRRLTRIGRPVTALARSDTAARRVAGLGATPVTADLFDTDGLAAAMRGCATVFHLAGVNRLCPRDPGALVAVNVGGTRSVVAAAAAAGVGRVVHTSSTAAVGERAGTVGRESTPHRGGFLSVYERSKFEGERAALATGVERGVEVVAVNPASVQGPGRVDGSVQLLVAYLNGRLPVVVDATVTIVDVDDCVTGHLLAERRGVAGERYLLAGRPLRVRQALRLLDELGFGPRRRPRAVPAATLWAAATLGEGVGRMWRRPPRVCRELAATLVHGHAYDGTRAMRDLGLVYTPLADTLRRTVAWLAGQGLVAGTPPGAPRRAGPVPDGRHGTATRAH